MTADAARSAKADGSPGAVGAGDPYYPKAGNGGYDATHYDLGLRFRPRTGHLTGRLRMEATAGKDLSRFHLDLDGLHVRSVRVEGRKAGWTRDGGELVVTPRKVLRDGRAFTTVVKYGGVPQTLPDGSGFIHTDDGSLVLGEPENASTWFPVDDHPSDKATYTFRVTVPAARQVVANGELVSHRRADGLSHWRWEVHEPMAPYLATVSVGRWDLVESTADGIRSWVAIDPDLDTGDGSPRTGTSMAVSGSGDSQWTRLTRRIAVPAGGATVSFWVDRRTEPLFDWFAVEARTAGGQDWTTLPDLEGHSDTDPGQGCPDWMATHPFLGHYETDLGTGPCRARGTSGAWNAASGTSEGWEQWRVDLGAWAGRTVELSLSSITDGTVPKRGVLVDDVEVSTGAGSTSFEADGDAWDGWTVTGPPAGSPTGAPRWTLRPDAGTGPSLGALARETLARQPEVIRWFSRYAGPYPFSTAGGTVDDTPGVGFALEMQTRPVFAKEFFGDDDQGISVLVHETAHQWFGDSVSVRRWRDVWLNEGFATYAEWLWSEHTGGDTTQEIFDYVYGQVQAGDAFWRQRIDDPGRGVRNLFSQSVYVRGAMTLHALRVTIGDPLFRTLLRRWAAEHRHAHGTTKQFERLAEKVSGRDLDRFFDEWLSTPAKPAPSSALAAARGALPAQPPAAWKAALAAAAQGR